jgi:putative ABC transport system permease protein
MRFLTVIFKNLLRRRTRSLLTVIGIAVGVAAVVTMTAIAWGFEKSWAKAYVARGTDLAVTKTTSKSPMPLPFDRGVEKELQKLPGVHSSAGILTDFMGIEESAGMVIFGWETDSFLWAHLKLAEGRWPVPGEKTLVLGNVAAELLGKKTGSKVQIDVHEFTVCGIFESSAFVENGAVIMTLPQMQDLTENPGKVNFVNLRMDSGTSEAAILSCKELIKTKFPGFSAFQAGELANQNTGVLLTKAMGWATSLIALIVGAIGMMNTVFMSVFERMHEIGVLLALGWRRSRIMRMILFESLLLSIVGGIVGAGTGALAVRLLEMTSTLRGRIEGDLSPSLFGMAFLVAVGLGLLGGLYPAWRGSRMSPALALRAE